MLGTPPPPRGGGGPYTVHTGLSVSILSMHILSVTFILIFFSDFMWYLCRYFPLVRKISDHRKTPPTARVPTRTNNVRRVFMFHIGTYLFLITSSRRNNCRRRQCLYIVRICINETNKLARTCARRRIPFCPTSLIISTVARNLLPSQVRVYVIMFINICTAANSI